MNTHLSETISASSAHVQMMQSMTEKQAATIRVSCFRVGDLTLDLYKLEHVALAHMKDCPVLMHGHHWHAYQNRVRQQTHAQPKPKP